MMLHNMLGGRSAPGRSAHRTYANRYRSETSERGPESRPRAGQRRKRRLTDWVRSVSSRTWKALANNIYSSRAPPPPTSSVTKAPRLPGPETPRRP